MAGSARVDFRFVDRADAYGFVRRLLVRSQYVRLPRSDKGLVRRFLVKVTGFSRAQVGRSTPSTGRPSASKTVGESEAAVPRRYTKADIACLPRWTRPWAVFATR